MSIRCFFGWHNWQIVQSLRLNDRGEAVVQNDARRQCVRCGKSDDELLAERGE